MYILKWKEKVEDRIVFLSELKPGSLRWDCAKKAKAFSSIEEFINMFNNIFVKDGIYYSNDYYEPGSYWESRTELIYIHPLNIPEEGEEWID